MPVKAGQSLSPVLKGRSVLGKSRTLSLGILLLSIAILAMEILLVRIFSLTLWHHLTYMVITVALLGFGAAGAYVAIGRARDEEQARRLAGRAAMGFCLSAVLGFAVVLRIPLDTFMADSATQLSFIFVYYLFLLPPFFFGGVAITVLLTHYVSLVHRLYFWNLVGSALGCFLFLVLLVAVGGDYSILLICALAAVAAAPIFLDRKPRVISIITAAICLLLLPVTDFLFPVNPAPSKALGAILASHPDAKARTIGWSPVGRIDEVSSDKTRLIGLAGMPFNKIFTIDGDAATVAYDVDRPWEQIGELERTNYSTAYHLKAGPRKVAVIGLGGGVDVMTALHFSAKEIVGVEINSAMIRAAEQHFADFSHNPYRDPRVTIVHEEGRSFLRRTRDKYDIIQMSGVDTWTALSSGAYVLSENYLYTTQAFEEYLNHLEADGILSLMRWVFAPPRETLRLCVLGVEVLRRLGKTVRPEDHFIVIQSGPLPLASFLIKVSGFTPREVRLAESLVARFPRAKLLYAPGTEGNNAFYRYFAAVRDGSDEEFISRYTYNISPVTDDQPFFFKFYRWGDIFSSDTGTGGYLDAKSPVGLIILVAALIQALLLGCAFVLYPLWRFRKNGLRTEGAGRMLAYFAALGLGFMFIEVALMQKFVLFLGHPTYSISVMLAGLLLYSGTGSFIAGKLRWELRRIILFSTFGVSIVTLFYLLALPAIFEHLIGAPHYVRILLAAVLIAPIGIIMGMPFPSGLAYIREATRHFVPWAFGVNGTVSVVASILSIIIAMSAGFTVVLGVAAAVYAVGGVALYSLNIRGEG